MVSPLISRFSTGTFSSDSRAVNSIPAAYFFAIAGLILRSPRMTAINRLAATPDRLSDKKKIFSQPCHTGKTP
jgi:hypothetical protein